MQTTLLRQVGFTGTGLHSGRPVRMTVKPAPAGHGVVFRRGDVIGLDPVVPALWDHVRVSPLNTRLVNADGVTVSTIEHLMAALAGCGIHNARVEIDGPEVPILDGSSAGFARALLEAGLRRLDAPLYAIEVLRPVEAVEGAAAARLLPREAGGLEIDFEIDFPDAAIGHQRRVLDMANGAFLRELCDSRTFCRLSDVEAMQSQGLALGGTYENAVVVDGAQVLSPGGLRHADEAVRHKMLDAVGDLATAGAPIIGRYEGRRAGHAMTNHLLRALFAAPEAWRWVEVDADLATTLPGSRLKPADLAAVA
ncbi:UDP-3-O-acyl-N-acetylglucosamine deacetylase [Limimaricola pyoseonensis]|uniref:UDP-3-O-acyl-N-acetylglucosamine deacetylase n=1 Tax=Limimaricola pyoseonensis TaxID=521013 RepID=A0A1G7DKM7_9RHOB|nr:UDP-3-O-acyl-N-acetylglucosamine deacetylase [Limimaricola pyoseonensis]SDE51666.1 UDP-3-O-[3-hydroxymyristoyl] N-acetylglucosamine deacetylase [Limimaricola pyoseonensis]